MRSDRLKNQHRYHQETFDESFTKLIAVMSPQQSNSVSQPRSAQINSGNLYETAQSGSKQLSQFIAKSWLPEGESIRKKILRAKPDEVSEVIKQLLREHEINVIDELESALGMPIEISLNPNSFAGYCTESRYGIEYHMPYPPKPSEINVDDIILKEWVEDMDHQQPFPQNLYILLTWC